MDKKLNSSIRNKLSQNPIWIKLVEWTKIYSIPGFQNVSIYNILKILWKELRTNDLNTRANAISYSFFLALFPSLIFLFTLTAYLPKSLDFYSTMESSILSIMPDGAQDYLWKNIINGLRPRAKSSFLSIGFFLAIFFASNGMVSLMRGFDKTYKSSFRRRKFWEKQAIAIFLTLLLGVLLIFSVLAIIFGGQIFNALFLALKLKGMAVITVKVLKYLIIITLFYSVIELIYRFGPALRKPFKGFSPGAIFATLISLLTSIIFSFFVDNFSTYHKVYGAISALLITLIWIRLNVIILILGFELNAAIAINKYDLVHSKMTEPK
ncbi:MAG TPA: YihY/virulence factor BrkB family protein [Saprospiraceae bacterium]|nr:YihY/virulence factor BrkB family protein [Saprospiraceae bacterium]